MKKLFVLFVTSVAMALACQKAPENVPVTSVSLNQQTAEMLVGETVQLKATVLPAEATDKSVIWASSNKSVAMVENGTVVAIAEGSTTITASSGGKSATCSVIVKKKTVDVTSVELNKTELALVEGDSETLTATVKPNDATDKTVTWSSSDSSVAKVDDGKVTAIKEGETTVTVKAGTKTATCKVTVSKKVIAVESIELDKTSIDLVEGDSETLTATVKPDNATDKTVTWNTSDSAIATVENGKVFTVKEGETTITAKAGDKSATCKVIVNKKVIAVESIALNKTSLDLVEGDSETLTATVKPDNATDRTVTWSTSDVSIAKVENGNVTAIKEGEATITAKAGEKSAICKVTVAKRVIPVESIELNKTTLDLVEGDSETLTATVKPDNATDRTVTWSTSDASIVKVENGKVTAIKEGTASITAKAGEKSVICKVVIAKKVISVESVELNKTSIELVEGDSETLTATVKPDNATYKTVTWSTSDASIAIIENGKVTAIKEGEATVTAKAGGKEANCLIIVKHDTLNDPIVFADSKIKAKLVAACDKDADGEVSYKEAASVKSFDGIFGDEISYSSFDECQYFINVTSISNEQFNNWDITSIVLPKSVKSIGLSAFSGCAFLTSIEIPDGVETIKYYTFYKCSSLVSITLPNSITQIQSAAFSNCAKLSSIILPEGLENIGPSAFMGCEKLKEISIPNSVTTLGAWAFAACGSLATVTLSENLYSLEDGVFNKCISLISLIIPDGVSKIKPSAFYGCGSLTSISIPSAVNMIGESAFSNCTGLTSITVLPTEVPMGSAKMFDKTNNCSIYVPSSSLAKYKEAEYWSGYADRIQAIQE